MSFNRVLDQNIPKRILTGALRKNLLASSYLFYGEAGTGKWIMALEMAKAINCEKNQGEACDVCSSCRKIDKFIHPDVRLIFPLPSAKSASGRRRESESFEEPETIQTSSSKVQNQRQKDLKRYETLKMEDPYTPVKFDKNVNIEVERIRSMQKDIYLKPFEGKRKVVIIAEAECMHISSANSLLKTLEEPPENTTLILTTNDINQLLPTVISRCQQIRFGRIPQAMIAEKLESDHDVEKQRAMHLAHLSHGSYGRALNFLKGEKQDIRQEALELLSVAVNGKTNQIIQKVDFIASQWDRNSILEMFEYSDTFMRDICMNREGSDNLINADMKPEVVKLGGKFKRQNEVEEAFRMIDQIRIDCQTRNASLKLALLNMCFRVKQLVKSEERTMTNE
jgi:DNA polymerase III subunit delta'